MWRSKTAVWDCGLTSSPAWGVGCWSRSTPALIHLVMSILAYQESVVNTEFPAGGAGCPCRFCAAKREQVQRISRAECAKPVPYFYITLDLLLSLRLLLRDVSIAHITQSFIQSGAYKSVAQVKSVTFSINLGG